MSLKKLMDFISKLRIVKHGDTILADDHNSLVNVSKSIQELFLPSGIPPEILGWEAHFFDNFMSSNMGSYVMDELPTIFYYFSNVFKTSLAKQCINLLPRYSPYNIYFRFPAWDLEINYTYPLAITNIATVSKPIPFGEINLDNSIVCYDVMYLDTYAMSYRKVIGLVYLMYSKDGGYIVILDYYNKVSPTETGGQIINYLPHTVYVKVSDDVFFDWIITEASITNYGSYSVRVLDKFGNNLISYTFKYGTPSSYMYFHFSSGFNYIQKATKDIEIIQVIQQENTYDWLVFRFGQAP